MGPIISLAYTYEGPPCGREVSLTVSSPVWGPDEVGDLFAWEEVRRDEDGRDFPLPRVTLIQKGTPRLVEHPSNTNGTPTVRMTLQ